MLAKNAIESYIFEKKSQVKHRDIRAEDKASHVSCHKLALQGFLYDVTAHFHVLVRVYAIVDD